MSEEVETNGQGKIVQILSKSGKKGTLAHLKVMEKSLFWGKSQGKFVYQSGGNPV